MELDILKQNTTWNDASASINNNFAKVKTALEQGGGGGTGGGGTIDESVLDLYTPLVRDFSDDFNNDFTR